MNLFVVLISIYKPLDFGFSKAWGFDLIFLPLKSE